jgi:hypothetical protein
LVTLSTTKVVLFKDNEVKIRFPCFYWLHHVFFRQNSLKSKRNTHAIARNAEFQLHAGSAAAVVSSSAFFVSFRVLKTFSDFHQSLPSFRHLV